MKFALTPERRDIVLDALQSYMNAPPMQDGRTPVELEVDADNKRIELIDAAIKPLLKRYLTNSIPVGDFKRQIDSINKLNPFWGFSGIKGQMFFNMLVKTAGDAAEFENQLRSAIREPLTEEDAATLLRNFQSYVTRIGQQFVDSGGEPYSKPKAGSVPFFLSYFWQIHRPDIWPVYYTNSVQMIENMNLCQVTGEVGEDYLAYKHLHETLAELFAQTARRAFTLYDIEHVFWFKSGRLLRGTSLSQAATTAELPATPNAEVAVVGEKQQSLDQATMLPDGYVPPIISIIPRLALNDPELQEAARRSGTSLARALEKSINAAFTVIGYETLLLGQGTGRMPDGQAIAVDYHYAILWDAKARSDTYRMSTDDRAIRQYIDKQSAILKRERGIRNIYYLILSSSFSDDFDKLIRSLKMETYVDEVCLVEATTLVSIVDQKLRSPLSISLGSDGIQRLFSSSGRVTADDVLKNWA
jgi:hypothetical protein